jgi:hypothetical protein
MTRRLGDAPHRCPSVAMGTYGEIHDALRGADQVADRGAITAEPVLSRVILPWDGNLSYREHHIQLEDSGRRSVG